MPTPPGSAQHLATPPHGAGHSTGRGVGCLALALALALTACSPASRTSVPDRAVAPPVSEPATPSAPPAAGLLEASAPAGPGGGTPNPGARTAKPQDVTKDAAGQYLPPSGADPTTAGAARSSRPPNDDADPLAVARAFIAARLTYRYDDPTGHTTAVTAPAYTTRAFAARSQPTGAALSRQRTSQEVSTVRVGAAEVEGEAPNTARTRYVSVELTTIVSYRGDGSSRPQDEVWTLRLVQTPAQQWRVDAVLSTS